MKRRGILFLILTLCLALSACGGGNVKLPAGTVVSGAENYIGAHYKTVLAELEEAGFTNIKTVELDDLTSDDPMVDGGVSEVSIDGNTSFAAKTRFHPNSTVIVTYRSVKKLPIPLSAAEIENTDVIEVRRLFEEAGFTNVETEEVYDLDPDVFGGEFENSIAIGSRTSFTEAEEFAFDTRILITCHRPYEKYDLTVKVVCERNLMFSRYDINIALDGAEQATLAHGSGDTYQFRIKEGKHTFTFTSAEDSTIKRDVILDVYCNTEASYRIACHNDGMRIEEVYVDRDEVVAEGQIKLMFNRSEFIYDNYRDVEQALRQYGFTNIETAPIYDIIFGIISPGDTDNVTINGDDTYKRGDIVDEDAKILITYHMPRKDDPSRASETSSEASSGASSEASSSAPAASSLPDPSGEPADGSSAGLPA